MYENMIEIPATQLHFWYKVEKDEYGRDCTLLVDHEVEGFTEVDLRPKPKHVRKDWQEVFKPKIHRLLQG